MAVSQRGSSSLFSAHAVASRSGYTVELVGELDIATAGDLNERIAQVCRNGVGMLVLDLRKLTFMDSTGLHAILEARRLCRERGAGFGLVPGPSQVQRVFEATRLLEVLPFQTEAAAE